MPRRVNTRDQIPSYLIVCEGKETEPNYFRAFHVGYVLHIKVEGLGKSAVSLVQEAINHKENGVYDYTWVVFDIDDCTSAQVRVAIQLAVENEIEVAYSNQAFELWYLLHFGFYQTAMDREQYIQKLTHQLRTEYKKNDPNLYVKLLNKQVEAIKNARQLFALYADSNDPCLNNPCTTVFKLVEQLNRFSRDSRR